jgi:hypothetical protein
MGCGLNYPYIECLIDVFCVVLCPAANLAGHCSVDESLCLAWQSVRSAHCYTWNLCKTVGHVLGSSTWFNTKHSLAYACIQHNPSYNPIRTHRQQMRHNTILCLMCWYKPQFLNSVRNGLVYDGIPYWYFFLFLNFIPVLINIWEPV